jgi:hypothetical protein
VQRQRREQRDAGAGELRGGEARTSAGEEREDEHVGERTACERRPESPHAWRAELPAGERRQPAQILARGAEAELRVSVCAVDEHDRHLGHAQPAAAVREHLEQDLEALRRLAEREQLAAPRGEEARERIARRADRPGERRRDPRREPTPQRPARGGAARDATATDRDACAVLEHGTHQRRNHAHRMRQVRVHHHHDIGARGRRARDHRAREAACPAPLDQPHRPRLRPRAHALDGAVRRRVVDHHHLEATGVVAEREDLAQQLIDVLDLVQGRDDDRECGSGGLAARRPLGALGSSGHRGGAPPPVAPWIAAGRLGSIAIPAS